ncbi:hypothetical protein AGMMS49525_10910 [Bacteroidia bacterium]|nr:hypothetical protein AGMMS49525_10910 [Bacteroidia bacterium]
MKKNFVTLWLAEQVTAMVADEKELSNKVMKIAQQEINDK